MNKKIFAALLLLFCFLLCSCAGGQDKFKPTDAGFWFYSDGNISSAKSAMSVKDIISKKIQEKSGWEIFVDDNPVLAESGYIYCIGGYQKDEGQLKSDLCVYKIDYNGEGCKEQLKIDDSDSDGYRYSRYELLGGDNDLLFSLKTHHPNENDDRPYCVFYAIKMSNNEIVYSKEFFDVGGGGGGFMHNIVSFAAYQDDNCDFTTVKFRASDYGSYSDFSVQSVRMENVDDSYYLTTYDNYAVYGLYKKGSDGQYYIAVSASGAKTLYDEEAYAVKLKDDSPKNSHEFFVKKENGVYSAQRRSDDKTVIFSIEYLKKKSDFVKALDEAGTEAQVSGVGVEVINCLPTEKSYVVLVLKCASGDDYYFCRYNFSKDKLEYVGKIAASGYENNYCVIADEALLFGNGYTVVMRQRVLSKFLENIVIKVLALIFASIFLQALVAAAAMFVLPVVVAGYVVFLYYFLFRPKAIPIPAVLSGK